MAVEDKNKWEEDKQELRKLTKMEIICKIYRYYRGFWVLKDCSDVDKDYLIDCYLSGELDDLIDWDKFYDDSKYENARKGAWMPALD